MRGGEYGAAIGYGKLSLCLARKVTGETKQGRGYFHYKIIPRTLQHELRGGWGLDDGPPANAWDAFKLPSGKTQP